MAFLQFQLHAQVHVKGYYRSNGTYVEPHERTRPNSTVVDNYSYPGNNNPNAAQAGSTEKKYFGPSPSPKYYTISEGAKFNPDGKQRIYTTKAEVNLRESPDSQSTSITTLAYKEPLFFIERSNAEWCKVALWYDFGSGNTQSVFRYVVGYVNSQYLSFTYPTKPSFVYVDGHRFEVPDYVPGNSTFQIDKVDSYLRRKQEESNQ